MARIPLSGSAVTCCMNLSFLYPFRIQMGRAGEPRIHNTTSIWLTQFSDRRYAALKVYICKPGAERESKVLGHLAALKSSHPGKGKVRTMLDTFIADGPNGKHQCLVHEPLLTSISHFQASLPNQRINEVILKMLLKELLVALDYLHTAAAVTTRFSLPPNRSLADVSQNIQSKNIMMSTNRPSLFEEWENAGSPRYR